ncbi:hypothetical protein MKW98_007506, partial [Papaver atlanticum]
YECFCHRITITLPLVVQTPGNKEYLDCYQYQIGVYKVSGTFEDEGGAQRKGIGIKLMDSLYQTVLSFKCNKSPGFLSPSEIECGLAALRVLDIILEQQAAESDARNFVSVGGGITEVQRFYSSFRTAQSGLTLTKIHLNLPSEREKKKRPILLRVLACISLSQFINTSSVRGPSCRVLKACCRRRRTKYSPLVSSASGNSLNELVLMLRICVLVPLI